MSRLVWTLIKLHLKNLNTEPRYKNREEKTMNLTVSCLFSEDTSYLLWRVVHQHDWHTLIICAQRLDYYC